MPLPGTYFEATPWPVTISHKAPRTYGLGGWWMVHILCTEPSSLAQLVLARGTGILTHSFIQQTVMENSLSSRC